MMTSASNTSNMTDARVASGLAGTFAPTLALSRKRGREFM